MVFAKASNVALRWRGIRLEVRANTVPMAFARAALPVTHAELSTFEALDTLALRERLQLAVQRITATGEDRSAAVLTLTATVAITIHKCEKKHDQDEYCDLHDCTG